jgi:hypothetical protein
MSGVPDIAGVLRQVVATAVVVGRIAVHAVDIDRDLHVRVRLRVRPVADRDLVLLVAAVAGSSATRGSTGRAVAQRKKHTGAQGSHGGYSQSGGKRPPAVDSLSRLTSRHRPHWVFHVQPTPNVG